MFSPNLSTFSDQLVHASAISVAATISMGPSKARSLSQTEENQARFPNKFDWSLMVGQVEEFSVY